MSTNHTFFDKNQRNRIIIPNKIIVSNYAGTITGSAVDQTSIDNYRLVTQHEQFYNITNNAQATLLAEAILAQLKVHAEMSSANVSMNIAQEVYDYIKITDTREDTTFVGNVGLIRRTYQQGKYQMFFVDGGWLSLRGLMGELEADGSPSEFTSIKAKYILAGQIDFTDISQDEIYDGVTYKRVKSGSINAAGLIFMDGVVDAGNTYQRVLATQISAGKVLLSDQCSYSVGYNPAEKRRTFTATPTTPYDVGDLWLDASVVKRCTTARATGVYVAGDWTATTLDAVAEGTTYKRVAATEISSGRIALTAANYWAGKFGNEWYRETGVALDASKGIALYGGQISLKTYPTVTDYLADTNVQCYVGTDGKIYAGAGAVYLDATGVVVLGQRVTFKDSAGTYSGFFAVDAIPRAIIDVNGRQLFWTGNLTYGVLKPSNALSDIGSDADSFDYIYGDDILPREGNDTGSLGWSNRKWNIIYRTNESACDLPTSNSATEVFKKIKPPKIKDGEYGKRHYFTDDDFPDEMKFKPDKVFDERGSQIGSQKPEIEFTRTLGVTVQTVLELIERIDALEAR